MPYPHGYLAFFDNVSSAALAAIQALLTAINNKLVTEAPGTTVVANVAAAIADTPLLAANANRIGGTVHNDSTSNCYVKLGVGANPASFTALLYAGSYYELPFGYTGAVNGWWVAAVGFARVTEVTP